MNFKECFKGLGKRLKVKDQNAKAMGPFRRRVLSVFLFLNRLAHFADVPILWYLAQRIGENSDNKWVFILYILPIIQLIRAIKWEFLVIKSNEIIRRTALNKRVQGFSGPQGAGKSSFMLNCIAVMRASNVYINFPAKIRGKYVAKLSSNVLDSRERIPDKSVLAVDEATMFYHNILCNIKDKGEVDKLYAQQLLQQILRHAFDGNIFYSSVDITRLPQMLKENIGLTNFMLGQGSVTLSYISGFLVRCVARLFGFKINGSVRFWDVQQLERIPEQGYYFDLSNQTKDTNDKNYANLIRFCSFNTATKFEYDDRFLRGLYAKLPVHIAEFWTRLAFDEKDLRNIGYGKIVDFFNKRIQKQDLAQLPPNADAAQDAGGE